MNIIKVLKNNSITEFKEKVIRRIYNKEKQEYYLWIKRNTPSKKELEEQRKTKFTNNPKISIIVPLYNTPKEFLLELIKFVKGQTYENWELCLADGSTRKLDYLNKQIQQDDRIKYKVLAQNKGISGNTNEALKMATGQYIALLDHDDLIPVNCLYEIVKAINENPDVEYLFTDEDKFVDINKKTRYEPNFKPDYSFDTFTSYNYICHFSIFKKELMDKLQGFRQEFDGSQDYDLILRAVENAKKIVHIPKILYHWRVHPSSTAGNAQAKPYCFEAGKNAVQEHLKRKGLNQAKMEYGVAIVRNRAIYELKKESKVTMFLYLKDSRIDLLKLKTDIEQITYNNLELIILVTKTVKENTNFCKFENSNRIKEIIELEDENDIVNMLNKLVERQKDTEQIIFAKDIQSIKTKDFVEQLLGFIQRGNVGVISPRIIHKNTNTQYNGTIYGCDKNKIGYIDYIDIAGSFGYITRGAVIQNYSVIKSECIMVNVNDLIQRKLLDDKMGYMESLADLSFELFKNYKKLNVINPHIEIETLERTEDKENSKFYKKWEEEIKNPDPNYNVNLRFEENKLFKIN